MLSLEGILFMGRLGVVDDDTVGFKRFLEIGSSIFREVCLCGMAETVILMPQGRRIPNSYTYHLHARPRHGVLGRLSYYICLIGPESHKGRNAGHMLPCRQVKTRLDSAHWISPSLVLVLCLSVLLNRPDSEMTRSEPNATVCASKPPGVHVPDSSDSELSS